MTDETKKPVLLTEADVERFSVTPYCDVLAELRARNLIAEEPVDPLYLASEHMRKEFMSSPAAWTDEDWHNALLEALETHAPDEIARFALTDLARGKEA